MKRSQRLLPAERPDSFSDDAHPKDEQFVDGMSGRPRPNRVEINPTGRPNTGLANAAKQLRGTDSLSPIHTTSVYTSYWRFASERQRVFMRRVRQEPGPWTSDPVINTFKFTNAYRASDRVSQYLIRHVIYRADLPSSGDEVFFRILLFKIFNRIETWKMLEQALGALTLREYRFATYDRILADAMMRGERIYSAAYIMPPGGRSFGHVSKHQNHLRLIELMVKQRLTLQLERCKSMQSAYELLLGYPTIGPFLAYQFVTDLNYSELTDFSEMDFVVPGPGARDGLRKCFAHFGGLSEAELIRLMADRQEAELERIGVRFENLWGRRLQLIDCQNLFCEVDKYARVMHPTIAGLSGRARIKQKFTTTGDVPSPWYPPKWGINDRIQRDLNAAPFATNEPIQTPLWT